MKWPWANIYSAIICITGVVDTCTTHTIVSPQQEIELIFGRRGQPSWTYETHDTVKGQEYARRNTYFRPEMRFPLDSRGGGRGEIFTSKLAYLRTQQTTTLVTYQREVSNRKLARTKLKQALARWIPPWSILKLLKFGNRHRFRQKCMREITSSSHIHIKRWLHQVRYRLENRDSSDDRWMLCSTPVPHYKRKHRQARQKR